MRRAADGLEQKETLVGCRSENPATIPLLGNCIVIVVLIKAEQRELKPVLPTLLAMTTASVATETAQQRDDLRRKIYLGRGIEVLNMHIDARRLTVCGDLDLCLTILPRRQVPAFIDSCYV